MGLVAVMLPESSNFGLNCMSEAVGPTEVPYTQRRGGLACARACVEDSIPIMNG